MQLASDLGYRVSVVFIFVGSPETCVERVKERVARGGHDVPAADVSRRFTRSLRNFWHTYRARASEWALFYNGGEEFVRVASSQQSGIFVADEALLRKFLDLASDEGV